MAKLSAHGSEVGTVDLLTRAKRYMSDGVILRNDGFGWKIAGKVKPAFTPQQAFDAANKRLDAVLSERPAWARYRKALHDTAGLSKRWRIHQAVSLMPDDPDGVWSECCDGYSDNVHADLDEVVELCRLYQSMRRELESMPKVDA